jgi:ubiquinone/menaquinone biosynthesis C-methylase UbiE
LSRLGGRESRPSVGAGSDDLFGAWAPTYAPGPGSSTEQTIKPGLIRQAITPGDLVLDVGCANGLHVGESIEAGGRLIGLDHSEQMVKEARSRNAAAIGFVRGDARRLPFRAGAFDSLYVISTLLLVDDLDEAIADVARVVRSGGTAVLDVQGQLNLSIYAWRWWYRRRGVAHLQAARLRPLLRQLREVGLEPEAVHATGFLDQWQYVPLLRRLRRLSYLVHEGQPLDRDYRVSNLRLLAPFANRWYVVARRRSPSGNSPSAAIKAP